MNFKLEATETGPGLISLLALVDEEGIWPHPHRADQSSTFDAEDVLSWLADAWPALLLEQSWPIAFAPDQEPRSLTGLLRAAEERWANFGEADAQEAEVESARVDAFLYAHDLSQMKHGAGLSPCLILRQQSRLRIETHGRIYEDIDFKKFSAQLVTVASLAEKILSRHSDPIAVRSIERWKAREKIEPIAAASFISGLPRPEIEALPDLSLDFIEALGGRKLSDIANDNSSPVPAAARASGSLGPAGLADILQRIKALPDGDTTGIEAKRRDLRRLIRNVEHPTDQGIRAAGFVRTWLDIGDDEPIDLDDLSRRLAVDVSRDEMADSQLDGIAIIGPRHGPAIMLNLNTRRKGAGQDDLKRSLHFTWAHEIGHLLLDHAEWAALVDPARQRVPRSVETRANAFATYLLLPQGVASRAWESEGSPLDWEGLEPLLNNLTGTFTLPRIVVSRQLSREVPHERRKRLEPVFKQHIENFDGR
jgi:IrrE N-terminal-like domain